jgi:hypothetical protein
MEETNNNTFSVIIISLLKGVIYRDTTSELWHSLIEVLPGVNDYAAVLGLECIIDEAEGYAFLKQKEDVNTNIPRLVSRRPISYNVSLLCVLLRKKILEFDSGGESLRVIVTEDQIIELMRIYMPDSVNEVKMMTRIKSTINKVIDLGFLRVMDEEKGIYEVRRIIKAFVDADWIKNLDEKLTQYRAHIDE